MKRLIQTIIGTVAISAAMVYAGGEKAFVAEDTQTGTTNSATAQMYGYLDTVRIDVPAGGYTGTVTVASPVETLFMSTNVTADAIYRPRVNVCNSTGAVQTAIWDSVDLFGTVTVTVITTASATTNDVTVYVGTTDTK